MKVKTLNASFICILAAVFAVGVRGQQVTFDAFPVEPSKLIPDLIRLRTEQPDLKPDEFAKRAKQLMQTSGLPFTFSFNDATCDSIAGAMKRSKLPADQQTLRIKLRSKDGTETNLKIPPADFETGECAKCSVTLPILEATDKTFITIVMGQNIGFERPGGFELSKIALIDDQKQPQIEREWLVPFRTKPIGISFDGRIIYLSFKEAELADIVLAVFSEGVFEIVSRAEAGSIGKQKKNVAENNSRFEYVEFDRNNKKFVLRYPSDCSD
jgi:hypothetical protein